MTFLYTKTLTGSQSAAISKHIPLTSMRVYSQLELSECILHPNVCNHTTVMALDPVQYTQNLEWHLSTNASKGKKFGFAHHADQQTTDNLDEN